jgi:hypothetical protein
MKKKSLSLSLTLLVLALSSALSLPACKERAGSSDQAEEITMQTFSAVLDRAEPQKSGISDLKKTGQDLEVVYNLYLPEAQDFDDLIGKDLAPKIEQLYKTFKTIDKVTFTVQTPDLAETGVWREYCSFEMTRKIYSQINWTSLLARDLFKVCKVRYAR